MMVTIDVEFYDKKTELIADDIRLEVPDDIVFAAAESTNVNRINCFMYDVPPAMKSYVIKQHPETEEKFEMYSCLFIGRHGLGEGY